VATLGVLDLVIVDTDDVLLVMDKLRAQEVKKIIRMYRSSKEGDQEVE